MWVSSEVDWSGYDLAVHGDEVVVGAIAWSNDYTDIVGVPGAYVLQLPTLDEMGKWETEDTPFDNTGAAVAIGDPDADGTVNYALTGTGVQLDSSRRGAVYHHLEPPAGVQPVNESVHAAVYTEKATGGGVQVEFTPAGQPPALLFSGSGTSDGPGKVFAASLLQTGELNETQVVTLLVGERPFAWAFAQLDLDLDGEHDVAVQTTTGVRWAKGPWTDLVAESSLEGGWTATDVATSDLGYVMTTGDVTGDGLTDLIFSARTSNDPVERAGRVYVVPPGEGNSEAVAIAHQLHGVDVGEGFGYALAVGDINGDGNGDLIVGAPGVSPGKHPGKILVFLGPLAAGSVSSDAADVVVHGERNLDFFGRSVAVADADGDGLDDLVVSAVGWPKGQMRGAVYLLTGQAVSSLP